MTYYYLHSSKTECNEMKHFSSILVMSVPLLNQVFRSVIITFVVSYEQTLHQSIFESSHSLKQTFSSGIKRQYALASKNQGIRSISNRLNIGTQVIWIYYANFLNEHFFYITDYTLNRFLAYKADE